MPTRNFSVRAKKNKLFRPGEKPFFVANNMAIFGVQSIKLIPLMQTQVKTVQKERIVQKADLQTIPTVLQVTIAIILLS